MTPKEYTFDAAYQPQVRAKRGTREIMLDVIIALLPALCVGVWQFGAQALITLAVSVVSCVFFEWAYRKLLKKPDTIGDLSAVVTGLLLAFNLPSTVPLYLPIIGAAAAILVTKQLFGGIGHNFANPAIVGRIALAVSFPSLMTAYPYPQTLSGVDILSSATPLAAHGQRLPLLDLLLGTHGGVLGETCALALLIGFGWLLCTRTVELTIPLAYLSTVAAMSALCGQNVLTQLLSGGLLLGAFFMATDYVTRPVTKKGQYIYGVILGFLTAIFRIFGASAEGVSYAIILGNLLVPLIERYTMPKAFGKGGERS